MSPMLPIPNRFGRRPDVLTSPGSRLDGGPQRQNRLVPLRMSVVGFRERTAQPPQHSDPRVLPLYRVGGGERVRLVGDRGRLLTVVRGNPELRTRFPAADIQCAGADVASREGCFPTLGLVAGRSSCTGGGYIVVAQLGKQCDGVNSVEPDSAATV